MGRLSGEALASSTLTGLSAATDVLSGYVRGTTTAGRPAPEGDVGPEHRPPPDRADDAPR